MRSLIKVKFLESAIDVIHWYKWKTEDSGGYRIKFDGYDLKIEIDPREENIIKGIIDFARKHKIKIDLK